MSAAVGSSSQVPGQPTQTQFSDIISRFQDILDPAIANNYPKIQNSPFSLIKVIAGVVFGVFSVVAYKQLYNRTAIGFAAVSLGAFCLNIIPRPIETTATKEQRKTIETKTAGIQEALESCTDNKIKAIAARLSLIDPNQQQNLNAVVDEHNFNYDQLASPYDTDDNAKNYKNLRVLAEAFLKIDFTKIAKGPVSPVYIDQMLIIRKAAKILVFGYEKLDNEDPQYAKKYFQVGIDQGKIVAQRWALKA